MKKTSLLIILICIVLVSCRHTGKHAADTQTDSSETNSGFTEEFGEHSEEWVRRHDKSAELQMKMGEVYNANPPGVEGFSIEDENVPQFIEGIYVDDDAILVIQVTGDSITGRRELEKVLGTEGFRIEHITKENKLFSQKQLYEIQKQLAKRVESLHGNPVISNLMAYGIGVHSIDIHLILNSSEKQKQFRKEVMDSPAFRFTGPEEPAPNAVTGVNDTLGIYLRPEYTVYSTDTKEIKFILYNRSGGDIECGLHYSINYEDEKGIWRELPINTFFVDVAYVFTHNSEFTVHARLQPDVHPNKPGIYRFFFEIRPSGKDDILMMSEFRLSNKREEWENPPKTFVIPKVE